MEKLIGIFIFKSLPRWQADSIGEIEKKGFTVILYILPPPHKNIKNKKSQDLLYLLEHKILKSPNTYLTPKPYPGTGRMCYHIQNLADIFNLPQQLTHFAYFISFAELNEETLSGFSKQLPVSIIQLNTLNKGGLVENIVKDYKAGETVINIKLYRYAAGIKSTVYNTCNSIEAGLLLKTINSILAKCSLIIPRYLAGHSNVDNLEVKEQNYSRLSYKTKKRNLLGSFLYNLADKIFYKRQWILLYQFMKVPDFNSINTYKTILPPKGKFWADPFPFFYKNDYFILFEELEYKNHKGYLSYLKLKNGVAEGPYKLIEEKYHLSFPNIIEVNEQLYMIPESIAASNIQLWKCISFPGNWAFEKNLIENIRAVDTIIEKINDTWWLFCTVKSLPDAAGHEELCIYYADDLFSQEWRPHPKNPVLSDSRMGRNAGKIQKLDGKLYRYGQFSGDTYGKALTKSEILTISETEYREEFIEIVFPDLSKGFYNLHTFNHTHEFAVGDALRRIRRF